MNYECRIMNYIHNVSILTSQLKFKIMTVNELKNILEVTKITVGLGLLIQAFYSGNYWYYLGIIPLVAGVFNICAVNFISKKNKK